MFNHPSHRLKIAFLTAPDPKDRKSWSGLHYMLGRALEKHVGTVDYLGPVSLRYLFALGDRINTIIHKLTGGKRYHYSISVAVSRLYAAIFKAKLRGKKYDLIFAPAAYTEFAFLNTDIPIVYCADSTITQLIDYYSGLSTLLPISKKELAYIEQRAISKADLLVYSSQWAASSAVEEYGAPPENVIVLPFGANIQQEVTRDVALQHRKSKVCKLLFVGVEWERKGGAIAFETLVELNKMGIDTQLTICGCIPPEEFTHEKMTVIPFLDKNDPTQQEQLVQLYLDADFFVLPTRAECAAVAFCEASAFGVPSITTDTGGIADFVVEGVNGYRLSLRARGRDFAATIKRILSNEKQYYQLRKSSRMLYEQWLNWDAWGKKMRGVLQKRFGRIRIATRTRLPTSRFKSKVASAI